jgi:hypothetical protein
MSKHFAPTMIRGGGGRIIHVSSMLGVQANPGPSAYGATKAGVNIPANVAPGSWPIAASERLPWRPTSPTRRVCGPPCRRRTSPGSPPAIPGAARPTRGRRVLRCVPVPCMVSVARAAGWTCRWPCQGSPGRVQGVPELGRRPLEFPPGAVRHARGHRAGLTAQVLPPADLIRLPGPGQPHDRHGAGAAPGRCGRSPSPPRGRWKVKCRPGVLRPCRLPSQPDRPAIQAAAHDSGGEGRFRRCAPAPADCLRWR